jgi:hypothetical protein
MRAPGQRTRNQLGLIVPSLALAVRVQQNGHNHLRLERLSLERNQLSQPCGKPRPQASDFLVFQQEDGVMQRVLVNAVAACEIEGVVTKSLLTGRELRTLLQAERQSKDSVFTYASEP